MIRKLHLLLVIGLALAWSAVAKADEYVKIEAAELKANPQTYWARGIIFSDILESQPTAEEIKLGDNKYYPVQMRTLGTCYVDASLKETVAALKLGDEYIFAGSVYQKEGGFFSSKRRFFVVIKRVTAAVKEADKMAVVLMGGIPKLGTNDPFAQPLHLLSEVLTSAQRELQAYCASSNIEISAVFTPGSPHAAKAVQAVRQSLYALENKTKVPTMEYAVSLVTSLLAAHNGGLQPAVEPAPVVVPEPVPAAPEVVVGPEAQPEKQPEVFPEMLPEPTPEPEPMPTIEPVPEAIPAPEARPDVVLAPEPAIEALPMQVEIPVAEESPVSTEVVETTDEAIAELVPEPVVEQVPKAIPLIDLPAVSPEELATHAPVIEETVAPEEPVAAPEVKMSLPGAKLKLSLEAETETESMTNAPPVEEPKPKAKKPSRRPSGIDLNAPVPMR